VSHFPTGFVGSSLGTPREDILPRSERLRVLERDVTKPESIAAAIEACGPVDVLVNNAGMGVVGVFEATPMATVREVFETNLRRDGDDAGKCAVLIALCLGPVCLGRVDRLRSCSATRVS
jgi:NAD(P)-dependent dehydrogenase (short-subunit alcohol dehydrogenase family)